MNTLRIYFKDKNRRKVGIFLASKVSPDLPISVGWSFCHPRDGFDKEKATEIAMARQSHEASCKLDCLLIEQSNPDVVQTEKEHPLKYEIHRKYVRQFWLFMAKTVMYFKTVDIKWQ